MTMIKLTTLKVHTPSQSCLGSAKLHLFIQKRHFSNSTAKPKVLIISGTTGTGKTTISVELAKKLNGEVISGDSVQVYKGLDIGSAKATVLQQKEIPHHLINVLEPTETFSASEFGDMATKHIEDILSRGKLPIVVGGSGFYIRTLMFGKGSAPPSSENMENLLQEARRDGWEKSLEKLKEVDPTFASQVNRMDFYRLVRALDVYQQTGKPYSSFAQEQKGAEDLPYDFRCINIILPRVITYRVVDYRCEKIILDGLLEETANLLRQNKLSPSSPASRSIGYRQAIAFLMSRKTIEDFQNFLTEFQTASRQFVHRQLTWHRQDPLFYWVSRVRSKGSQDHFSNFELAEDWTEILKLIDDSQVAEEIIQLFNAPREEYNKALQDEKQTQFRQPERRGSLKAYSAQNQIFGTIKAVDTFLKDKVKGILL